MNDLRSKIRMNGLLGLALMAFSMIAVFNDWAGNGTASVWFGMGFVHFWNLFMLKPKGGWPVGDEGGDA